jgi:PilZ domain
MLISVCKAQFLGLSSSVVDDTKASGAPPAQSGSADRRTQPRYRFTAHAQIIEDASGKNIEAHVGDISERGCHAQTTTTFPLGTVTKIVIRKGTDSFAAQARVVYSSGDSIGLAFSDVAPDQLRILQAWLGSSRERDWLTRSRRRTQRVLMRVRVRVSGQSSAASRFDEETHTLAINAHGASIPLSKPVSKGQRLELSNVATGDRAECIVAYIGQRQGGHMEVGVEFILASPKFWHVVFPPTDWTQPVSGIEQ